MTAAIAIRDLHKRFGKLDVLRGIDLDIAAGEGVVLLGANGCGKSTMMRCLNGLERHDSGTIAIGGTDISRAGPGQLRKVRRQLGYVFQQFNLVPNVSSFQNVLYGALGRQGLMRSLGAFASHADRDMAMACLERVGLVDKAAHRPSELSGGQQQRVAIARMLMQDPQIVVADEPIASLDPKAGREVLELLWQIVEERKLTVLCTLHQLDLAQEFGKRIVGMKAGRIEIDAAGADISRAELNRLYADSGLSPATRQDEMTAGEPVYA
jgi:phosphonate transport system ATP-binding protein